MSFAWRRKGEEGGEEEREKSFGLLFSVFASEGLPFPLLLLWIVFPENNNGILFLLPVNNTGCVCCVCWHGRNSKDDDAGRDSKGGGGGKMNI